MAIEFPCPTCRQLVRTPDAAAGKKGKCPSCGTVVIIPAPITVVAPTQPPRARGQESIVRNQETQGSSQPPAGTMEFACPACSSVVRTPVAAAGKKGKCPQCQALVAIPELASAANLPPKPEQKAVPRSERSPPQPAGPKAPASLLPMPPASPYGGQISLPAGPPRPLTPMPGSSASPAVPILAPLRSQPVPGLTPLAAGPVAGLTPLPKGPVPGLTPLPAGVPMLTPAAMADPLAGLPAVETVGVPASKMGSPLNPYSSPFATAQPAYLPRPILDRNRKGLPWEYDPSMDTFGDTMHVVLSSPTEAFRLMRRRGGIVNPMAFFIIGGILGQIPSAVYATVIEAIVYASLGVDPFPVEQLLMGGSLRLIVGIIVVFLGGAIGMFIFAAIYHVCLVLVGGANAGYEATYRALCFSWGSIAVLNAIPIVGPLIGIFYILIVMIHAFTHTHEIDGGKAALAVFLPLLVGCCCLVPFGFLMLGGGLMR